ncbi:branched-chain amino acid transport system II carrier protein [Legionella gresilensis]|uniref:branched-chain amino acid transport system II carrier protein n=1 Tax=Legionella gresilensis TaxID=91823 RepID=UPI001041313A|nr:branched-chain amino acid transport system II carrier protein [Legionella gresilensis]
MQQQYKLTLIYGFAIFVMFFGSGNLVFPLQIGYTGGSHWFLAFIGLLLTGIFLPLLGLFVIKLYHGNYLRFFNEAGKLAGAFLPFLILSLLGSFGVVPRCITVAYGSISYLFPQIPLMWFSLAFCLITFFLCLNDTFMVKALGKWMSPLLLSTLIILIFIAVIKAPANVHKTVANQAFSTGFLTGYQTMDLFAAFFFSSLIFKQIQKDFPKSSNQEIIRFAIKPSILGATLLGLIYLGLVYLGSHYAVFLADVRPELILPTIAAQALGSQATLFMAITMFFSCLTTAVALNNLFARYLATTCKVNKDKFFIFLILTTGFAFIISLLDFKGIAAFLNPILQLTYPALIVLTVLCLFLRKGQRFKMASFYFITGLIGLTSLHLAN